MVCNVGNGKEMAGAKSEKEAKQNYTINPFTGEFFDVMSSV